jgi:RHS repeat-associated protein
MHIKHLTSGVFNNVFMAFLLAWLCCNAASAATSVSVAATPSAATAPANVTLSVAVTADPDPVTVARVQYYNGNSSLGVATTAPFNLNLTGLGPGNYVIKAIATLADAQNTQVVSAPAALTVTGGTAASAAVYYIHTDQLNTPRVIADQNQAVVWKWESDGFGAVPPNEQLGAAAAFEFNLRFAGQYFDRESNLHYNYFRDYDPQLGRYVQSDPLGIEGGIDTYNYVEASPLNLVDPYGLNPATAVGAGIGTAALPGPGTVVGAIIGTGVGIWIGYEITKSDVTPMASSKAEKERASRLAANVIAKSQGRNGPNKDDDKCDKQEKADEQQCLQIPWQGGLRGRCMASAAIRAAQCRAGKEMQDLCKK